MTSSLESFSKTDPFAAGIALQEENARAYSELADRIRSENPEAASILLGGVAGRTLFLTFGRHEWGEIHTWLAYVSIALLVVHLLLNWQWLVKVAASKHTWRLAAGILTGLFIVGAFLLLPVEKFEQNGQKSAAHLQIDR